MTIKNEISFSLADGRTIAFEVPEKNFHEVMRKAKQLQEIDNPYYSVSVLSECDHTHTEDIDIPGSDERITICHECGVEL